ncbi:hypothetical protein [Microvirga puerhi]|uniref:DUF768 domain-containing protein n=1 Tax=Microvirga puerhi TaxID=2876078 RepID=A0ABS7VUP1_9HYPH|nr:hypothetical protein [Microvirga puerhi]MBZ6078894.1 hypothetical protein [Microvirga puerhi]
MSLKITDVEQSETAEDPLVLVADWIRAWLGRSQEVGAATDKDMGELLLKYIDELRSSP